jgi:2-polyprenyl-3-methyl-5-hydroxy-6-metoxy-1,4-benzoquinol methylase
MYLGDQYLKLLEKEIVGCCETLLDIGCGPSSPIKNLSSKFKQTVGVDCYEPCILQSRSLRIHDEYKIMNALEVGEYFKAKSFDCVLASNLIEHLSKKDGLKVILMMERIAKKKVIISTPNGFIAQDGYDVNPYEVHLSGWEVDEMEKMDFRVIGMNGWKLLRGEVAAIKWRPSAFWESVSLLTQMVTTNHPKYAFQLLCIKDL